MGKKGVPVRMNSEKKTSRVAIKTASRQIKKQKNSHELEFKLLLLLASSTSKREEHFEISTTQTYTVNSRGFFFKKPFLRGLFLESLVFTKRKLRFKIGLGLYLEGNLRLKSDWSSL